jgi:hypothetical protein
LNAIQHTGVFVLFSGFECNSNLNAIFPALNFMGIWMLSNIQVSLHILRFEFNANLEAIQHSGFELDAYIHRN